MRLLVVPLAILITPLPSAANSLFGFIDETGVAHFSDFAADRRYKRLSGPPPTLRRDASGDSRPSPPHSNGLRSKVRKIADEHGVDPALAMAVIEVESAGRVDARSPKGAIGLMQLMPATAQRYGVVDRLDPDENLRGGIRYLRDLLARFGNTELALAAYNAGEGAVMRHAYTIPPFAETRAYVPKVLQRYAVLQREPAQRSVD